MTRRYLWLVLITALAAIAVPTATAQANDCTYNAAITGECHQAFYLDNDDFIADGHHT